MTEIQNTEKIPFFSVVIPVYNKGPHISRSISSVLNQSCQEFELIVINDASTDNSLEEIGKFDDKRIRVFSRNKPGPGGYAARNLGIEFSRGEWIAFLDADDEWYPEHLNRMHALTEKYQDIFFLGCGWQTQANGRKKECIFYKENRSNGIMILNTIDYLRNCISRQQPVWTSVACIRRTSPVALQLFPSDTDAKRGGDLHAWLKIMCYHKKLVWSNHLGAVYNMDSSNMVTKNYQASLTLLKTEVYRNLASGLNSVEQRFLKKYLNYRIRKQWISKSLSNEDFSLPKALFWKANFLNAFKCSFLILVPKYLFRIYYRNKTIF